jgi:hypothetical protein
MSVIPLKKKNNMVSKDFDRMTVLVPQNGEYSPT